MIIPKPKEMIIDQGAKIDVPKKIKTTFKNCEINSDLSVYSKLSSMFTIDSRSDFEISFELLEIQNEGYDLNIENNKIKIIAGSQSGFYYALTTLEQIIEINKCLYKLEVKDFPNYETRELSIDSVRHFIPLEDMKKIINLMSIYKFNILHWHLTDDQGWRIESERFPLLNEVSSKRSTFTLDKYIECEYSGSGYYTKNEIIDLVSYAKAHNIDIMPELNLPGHTLALLAAYPEYGCENKKYEVGTRHGVFDEVMCIGNENLFIFIRELFEELLELFPYKYVHIGGDEVPFTKWDSCPKCNKLMQEKKIPNASKLQVYFTNEIINLLREMGRECIAWNEAASADIKEKFTIAFWNEDSNYADVEKAVNSGNKIIDMNYKFLYLSRLNGKPGIEEIYYYNSPFSNDLDGYGCALWTERVASFNKINKQLLPRILCASEICWGTKREDFNLFIENVILHEDLVRKYGFNINLDHLEYDPKVEEELDFINKIIENEDHTIVMENWSRLKSKYE